MSAAIHMAHATATPAIARPAPYDGVAVAVPVTVPYVRLSDDGAAAFVARALARLLADSGLPRQAVDGLALSSFTLAPDSVVTLTQQLGLDMRWLEQLPMGGASAVIALRRAARAVQAGDASVIACIGADTNGPASFRDTLAGFSRFARDAVLPYAAGGPNASFALITAAYMREYGATREDFARLCIAQRANAALNPNALLRAPLTLEAYLAARPIADPLCLYDCVMPCAGADAFLVMDAARARAAGLPHARILGAVERFHAYGDDPLPLRGGWAAERDTLYAMAGLGPADIDAVQSYDDYPVITLMQFEDLGFCAKGEGPDFLRRHDFSLGGDLPTNTGGGQLSAGQAGAAGGYLGLVEGLRQVLGQAGQRQLARARHMLVSGFGLMNYDRGLCTSAAILAGAQA